VILADTSVLIDYLRGAETAATRLLDELVRQQVRVHLAPVTIQEILQGARDEQEWRKLHAYLTTQPVARLRDPVASHADAARIYFDCRRQAITLRSAIDCMIAQIALDHDLALLHDDRDFEKMRSVRPRLRTLP
jgi:hypothetical protein